jgi:gamma-glutamyltranspeptidase/glutathione hydrolase
MGFGSGVVVPNTGIANADRGACFVLAGGHPNQVGSGKRPFHTSFLRLRRRAMRALMSFGVMGADMQPQGHIQMMIRLADYHQNPQQAADGPRWKILPGR